MTAGYVNPGSFIAVSVILPVLATIAVTGRTYSRWLKGAKFGADDYLSIAATILLWGDGIDLIVGVANKVIGYNSSGIVPLPKQETLGKIEIAFNQIWFVGIALAKLAFLFLYRRIFRGTIFSVINWIVIGGVICWAIIFWFISLLQCGSDVSALWNPLVQKAEHPTCLNDVDIIWSSALTSFFFDLVILIIPMPWIWQLNLQMRVKMALTGLFAVGAFCVAASGVRLGFTSTLWGASRTGDFPSSVLGVSPMDSLGITSVGFFWSYIEFGVGTIACCLPTLKPLVTEPSSFLSLSSLGLTSSKKSATGASKSYGSELRSEAKDDQIPMTTGSLSSQRKPSMSDSDGVSPV